ncbi:MAG TPA: HD domain-containing phosphohydrolase [Armatimonadota bacterium]|jgi:putative nucleotidyltransferase with HDIG domain
MPLPDQDTIRILVVDDEDVVREPLTEALGWVGYIADGAASVDEALDMLIQHKYDLLFCDLVMPGANGFTLMEVVRRKYAGLPVIVLTGHATVDLTQKAIRLGAQDFIIKPFSVRELPFIVERNLERVRLEAQLREQQTEHLLFQTVQALAAAIEAKDPYTAGHSQKVAQLALQFSQSLDLSSTDVFVLRLAGLMHDVGKIGIPEGILLKPAQLNEREWEIMKQHPVIGAEIVGQITDLGYVSTVVRSHHERWDGTGYPDGLKGESIPFLSRILYISDAYDALTADRAYRKGMSHEQAVEIILKQAGVHFDIELVNVLIEKVLPSLRPDWRTPGQLMSHLSRTKQEALDAQEVFAIE